MRILTLVMVLSFPFLGGCTNIQKTVSLPEQMQPDRITSIMTNVVDWQLANPKTTTRKDIFITADWTYGAFYAGLAAWAQMADTDTYNDALMEFGETNEWKLYRRKFHADDHVVAQMYISMYDKYQDPAMIQPTIHVFDEILANQPTSDMKMIREGNQDRWNWCDALFMAPPVWAKLARITGETKYLEFMNKEWWATTDYLYDEDEHLYYRDSRYFDRREENGEKVFWSRGNGWVLGGLVRVLEELPADYPDRSRYEKLYKEMAARLIKIQPENGLWHPSLLDTVSYPTPEASGSGFYCYGLAWGINNGLLDEKKYLPAVIKTWTSLVDCVHPDGMVGHVQPIGKDPRKVTADQTDVYGAGAFLLAGSEVYKIAVRKGADVQKIVVTNPLTSFRDVETVALDWKKLTKTIPGLTAENVAVFDFKTNCLLVTQVVADGDDSELLFQTGFAPGETKRFWVMPQPSDLPKPQSTLSTHCRYVPEREDDFAWENDRVAFRMYGAGLWEGAENSGVDCWLKRVDYPVIDKWYGNMKQKTYHKDWGEGYDPYHVGASPGCGGLRIVEAGNMLHSNVYDGWKVIENGPIRSIFELTYDKSWKESGKQLVETKRISIDLGQQLCRIESTFAGPDAAAIKTFAVGVTTHDQKAKPTGDNECGIVSCWETIDGYALGTAAIADVPEADSTLISESQTKDQSYISLIASSKGTPEISYYAGFVWARAGRMTTKQEWKDYLKDFKDRIVSPVSVQYIK